MLNSAEKLLNQRLVVIPKKGPRRRTCVLNRSQNWPAKKTYAEAREYALTNALCQYASVR